MNTNTQNINQPGLLKTGWESPLWSQLKGSEEEDRGFQQDVQGNVACLDLSAAGIPKEATASSSEKSRTLRVLALPTAYPQQHSGSFPALCPRKDPAEQSPGTPILPGRNRRECLQMSQVPEIRSEIPLRDAFLRTPLAAEKKRVGMGNRMGPSRSRWMEEALRRQGPFRESSVPMATEGTGNLHGSQRQSRHSFSVWYSPL